MSTPQRPVRPVVRKQIPSTVQSQKETTSQPEEKKSSALKMVLIIIPLLLLVGAGALIVYTKNNEKDLASLNIFGRGKEIPKNIESTTAVSDSIAIADSLASIASGDSAVSYTEEEISTEIGGNTIFQKDENPAKQTLIDKQKELSDGASNNKEDIGASTTQHGRYFVIVGSFMKKENAYKFRNKIANSGGHVTVIEPTPDNRFYKVAFDDFDNKEDALRKKNELGSDFGSSVWVMTF
jgi:cell division protein FtsN